MSLSIGFRELIIISSIFLRYGKRISIEPCDPASTNQQWEFVYLYEIPRVRSNIE